MPFLPFLGWWSAVFLELRKKATFPPLRWQGTVVSIHKLETQHANTYSQLPALLEHTILLKQSGLAVTATGFIQTFAGFKRFLQQLLFLIQPLPILNPSDTPGNTSAVEPLQQHSDGYGWCADRMDTPKISSLLCFCPCPDLRQKQNNVIKYITAKAPRDNSQPR